jgi:hypothetical protein
MLEIDVIKDKAFFVQNVKGFKTKLTTTTTTTTTTTSTHMQLRRVCNILNQIFVIKYCLFLFLCDI